MTLTPYGDNFIPVIPTDQLTHTDQHPCCADPDCPCHDELKQQLNGYYQEGIITDQDATHILEGRQVWQ
jgi:hypothetical protein